jgi:hypothetical protein
VAGGTHEHADVVADDPGGADEDPSLVDVGAEAGGELGEPGIAGLEPRDVGEGDRRLELGAGGIAGAGDDELVPGGLREVLLVLFGQEGEAVVDELPLVAGGELEHPGLFPPGVDPGDGHDHRLAFAEKDGLTVRQDRRAEANPSSEAHSGRRLQVAGA